MVGDRAPDFDLEDQEERKTSLKSLHGKKVLLAFFPFAFSPVCTDEMCFFDRDMDTFRKMRIHILGISTDSKWSLKAFSEKLDIHFPLLSDFSKKICQSYEVLRKEGFSERAYILVDENGCIAFKKIMESPGEKLENSDLLQFLE